MEKIVIAQTLRSFSHWSKTNTTKIRFGFTLDTSMTLVCCTLAHEVREGISVWSVLRLQNGLRTGFGLFFVRGDGFVLVSNMEGKLVEGGKTPGLERYDHTNFHFLGAVMCGVFTVQACMHIGR